MSSNETSASENETNLIPAESSAVALIREAIKNNADPAQLRELLAVRREWEGDEARKAYNLAIAEFQRVAPIVAKLDKGNKAAYAALDRIWSAIRPALTELGLSVTWRICELRVAVVEGGDAICHLEGELRHKLGHSERLVMDLPIPEVIKTSDGRAVTNAAQMMGSAVTYAKRYGTCAALGVITGEDDDASGAAKILTLDDAQRQELSDLVQAARGVDSFDENKFWAWLGCDKIADVYKRQFPGAVQALKLKIKEGNKR